MSLPLFFSLILPLLFQNCEIVTPLVTYTFFFYKWLGYLICITGKKTINIQIWFFGADSHLSRQPIYSVRHATNVFILCVWVWVTGSPSSSQKFSFFSFFLSFFLFYPFFNTTLPALQPKERLYMWSFVRTVTNQQRITGSLLLSKQ